MKNLKYYSSFKDLKSSDTNSKQKLDALEKHQAFANAIAMIRNRNKMVK